MLSEISFGVSIKFYYVNVQHKRFISALFIFFQGRLGPGRLHHCMRLIGAAERGMQLMAQRALHRKTFGKLIAQHGSFLSDIAKVI